MPEPEPLNLVPIMNLVTILIPVLLMAIKSLELAVIDTSLPAISTSVSAPPDNIPDKPPLQLKMAVTNQGIRILGANEYLYPGQAKTDNADEEKGKPECLVKAMHVVKVLTITTGRICLRSWVKSRKLHKMMTEIRILLC
jgi:hypothetical protein